MTAITTLSFLFLLFRSFKHKQICLVAIVKQVCRLMNDNERRAIPQLDHIDHHRLSSYMKQMDNLVDHRNELLKKRNVVEVLRAIHQQISSHRKQVHRNDKKPKEKHPYHRTRNLLHPIEKIVQRKRKPRRQPTILTRNKLHKRIMPNNKISPIAVFPLFPAKFSIVRSIFFLTSIFSLLTFSDHSPSTGLSQ